MSSYRHLCAAGLALIVAGCDAEPGTVADRGLDGALIDAAMDAARPPGDAGPHDAFDAQPIDAQPIDAQPIDAQPIDAQPVDAQPVDAQPVDAQPIDAALPDQGTPVDASACVAEACNDLDDDCDGLIDEGDACVAAVVAGCRLHLALHEDGAAPVGVDSGGDGLFHGLGPSGDVDAGDRMSIAWRCEVPVAWAQARCAVSIAHANGSEADPLDCARSRCARSDGEPASLQFAADVDGDDRFAVGFNCADEARPARAMGVQAGVRIWLATQHRRVAEDGACLDEPRHDRVAQWGFCPGLEVDDEGRHRCAGSAGDGSLHMFSVGTLGGVWPDLGRCDTFGVAVTR